MSRLTAAVVSPWSLTSRPDRVAILVVMRLRRTFALPTGVTGPRMRKPVLRYLPLFLMALAGVADATEIPIGGTYGTVAMCIIDAFTDVPSAEINYSVGGAPLARVMPGEF